MQATQRGGLGNDWLRLRRLFWLELRRSAAWWLVLPVAGFVWLLLRDGGSYTPVVTWLSFSINIGVAACLIAPLLAGVAAWQAGRDQRCRLDDLLATTPGTLLTRAAPRLSAVALLGFAAWLLGTVVALGMLRPAPRWGVPRTLAPQSYLIALNYDVFHHYAQLPAIAMALCWLGVGLLLFAVVIFWLQRSTGAGRLPLTGGLSTLGAVALAVLVAGVALLPSSLPAYGTQPRTSWQPTCSDTSVPICVHPAFAPVLPDLRLRLEPLLDPVAGAPGAPTRALHAPDTGIELQMDGTLPLLIDVFYDDLAMFAALSITTDVDATDPLQRRGIAAQIAVAKGLVLLTGAPVAGVWFPHAHVYDTAPFEPWLAEMDAAAVRFAALDDATRRAWLHAHLADLRRGAVLMEELP